MKKHKASAENSANPEQIREQARSFTSAVSGLATEVERLSVENAALRLQIAQVLSAGAEFGPDVAEGWLKRFEQLPAWKKARLGTWRWDKAAGRPEDNGLRGLRQSLIAEPMSNFDRILWDRKEANRVANYVPSVFDDYIPARPAPDFKEGDQDIERAVEQKHPGLGKTFKAVVKGRLGRLRLVIELAFLIYGTDAVDRLTSAPEAVLEDLLERCRSMNSSIHERWARCADRLNGGSEWARANARFVLGVDSTATPEAIKAAYRQLAKQCHPDIATGDAETFTRVASAYDLLMN
jgi:hypothetical protein